MSGKRAAPRRASPGRPRAGRARLVAMLAGVVATVVAWVFLVRAAIDFGASARAGTPGAWAFLGLAGLGAIACLFLALMLLTWTARALGLVRGTSAPRTPGGRRAAR